MREAYERTLRVTGASIIFTGITLAIGVVTWVFSPLKFQADIGVMLTFMFLVNMLGAIILLPALAAWLVRPTSFAAQAASLRIERVVIRDVAARWRRAAEGQGQEVFRRNAWRSVSAGSCLKPKRV